METKFLFSSALTAMGLPLGAVPAAVRLVQWAEVHHGMGVSLLEHHRHQVETVDPSAIRIVAETDASLVIDGGRQSSLLVGPSVLDLVTAKAHEAGVGMAVVGSVTGLGLLGYLAELAARRGLVSLISFQCSQLYGEYKVLKRYYSCGRTIVSFPNECGPLWLDMPFANESHIYLMTHRVPLTLREALRNAFTPVADAPSGFSLICWPEPEMSADAMQLWGRVLQAATSAGANILDPEGYTARKQYAIEHGLFVEDDAWHSLTNFGLTTVMPSSERSLRSAGAEAA